MLKGMKIYDGNVLVAKDDYFKVTTVAFFLDDLHELKEDGITLAKPVQDAIWVAQLLLEGVIPKSEDASDITVGFALVNGEPVQYAHDGRYGRDLHEAVQLPVELDIGPNGAQVKRMENVRILAGRWVTPERIDKPARVLINGVDLDSAWSLKAMYDSGKGWEVKFKDLPTWL